MKNTSEMTESIVLRQVSYGDHDRIMGLYTRRFGKISAFAASAKKSQKRFGSSLDLFSHVQAEVSKPQVQGKNLWRLQRVDLINPNVDLRKNLFALSYVSYFSDCVWNLLAEEDVHEDVFDFLLRSIEWFSSPQMNFTKLLNMEVELLQLCGYGPHFFECVECNKTISAAKVFFSFSKGGVVCASCSRNEQGLWMPTDILETTISTQTESEKDFLTIRNVLDRFVTFIVGRELKSQSFRKEVHDAGI